MRLNKNKLLSLTLGLVLTAVVPSYLSAQAPTLPSSFDKNDVNSFDQLIMNPYSKPLDKTADVMVALTMLTPAVMVKAPVQDYWKIGVSYAETLGCAYGTKELFKHCVNRARPYMYFDGAPQDEIDEGDWCNSFISGHSTMSFAAASFTAFTFCEYFPDSKYKLPVIIGSYALATTTSCLRLASGNHFMTDVLCGALVGTGIGILVPWLNSLWIKPSFLSEASNVNVSVTPVSFKVQILF